MGFFLPLVLVIVIALIAYVNGCSNIIVSSGASLDSSTIVAYNADSSTLYGSLYHYPAADHAAGSMRDIFDWDSGVYLGQIKEVEHTYNVVGNSNEYGLIIGETTFGGIEVLQEQKGAKIDYGSLIWVTLQRSRTAREAIETLGGLMKQYGYASEGESFSIIDQNEAWVMEIIGKGEYELGAVWVAVRIPEGYVTAHANQARIQTFPLNDPENCLYSPDVVSFARKIGLYSETASDAEFSFSDVYDPVSFSGARICDARVWSFFGSIMGSEWASQYEDYAYGYNLTNRMPLFVKPAKKISVKDTMGHMRNHYEGTSLDMTGKTFSDVGAIYANAPVRSHPLSWSSKINPDGTSSSTPVTYTHERPIATTQTGWNFVAQSRRWMPRELAALFWFGVDDSSTTVRFPIYGSATRVPQSFAGHGAQDGVTPPMMTFSLQSAFYVFNLVANWAYSRWDLIYPEVLAQITTREEKFMSQINEVDSVALKLYNEKGPSAAVEYVTSFSEEAGNSLVKDWVNFFGELFVKYRDGYVITRDSSKQNCGCSSANAYYPQDWYDRIVKESKGHFYYGNPNGVSQSQSLKAVNPKFKSVSKLDLLNRK